MSAAGCVLVTGGTGFIGGHLVEAIARDGGRVRILARTGGAAGAPVSSGIESIRGDVTDPRALAAALREVDVVYHLASLITEGDVPANRYREVNVGGTERLLEAAAAAGVRRFVFTSSMNVYAPCVREPIDETTPTGPDEILGETKLEAEALIRDRCAKSSMEFVVLRPPRVYGPRDRSLLKLFRMIRRGRFRMIGDGKGLMHPIHVDDLVRALLLAGSAPGAVDGTFVVAGPDAVTKREFCERVAQALGRPLPAGTVPKSAAVAAAILCEGLCKVLRVNPPVSRRRIRFFLTSQTCRPDRIAAALGFRPAIGLQEGLDRTAKWYGDNEWL